MHIVWLYNILTLYCMIIHYALHANMHTILRAYSISNIVCLCILNSYCITCILYNHTVCITCMHAYMDTVWSILYAHCFMFHLHSKSDSISFVFWYVIYKMFPSMRFNLQFEACGCKCEIRNVDTDEYSYIVFIKKMKQCIANKNE